MHDAGIQKSGGPMWHLLCVGRESKGEGKTREKGEDALVTQEDKFLTDHD